MRQIIDFIAVIASTYLVLGVLRGRTSHRGKAIKKIGFIILSIAMVLTVIFPWITDMIAHFVGVGSGVNLIVYFLGLAFIASSLNAYLRQQDNRDIIIRLARRIAIIEASSRYKDRVK